MILEVVARHKKAFAIMMLTLLYFEAVLPGYAFAAPRTVHYNYRRPGYSLIPAKRMEKAADVRRHAAATSREKVDAADGGPGQPESRSFHSVGNQNMVDLFTGDFSYTIPLLDIDGYPLAIGYHAGVTMDQEASWVGLGWNINPGSVTRNMRGLPDDFSGTDTIQKMATVKENRTVGVTVGADVELTGRTQITKLHLGASLGVLYNSYKGIGIETGINTSINAGAKNMGSFTAGLSATNSSQDGLTIGHSLAYKFADEYAKSNGGMSGSVSMGTAYNSREGLKALTFSGGLSQYREDQKNCEPSIQNSTFSTLISFAHPSFTPSINLPYTNSSYNYTAKIGSSEKVLHPNLFVSGYVAKQRIADEDKRIALPAYGYLNYQMANGNEGALLDYNREKEIAYREKPEVPNIAVPSYTYDVFSISGEGTGGMFRAYRGDIGYVYDHAVRTKDNSASASIDIGVGDLAHFGVDLHKTRAYTQSGPWLEQNPLSTTVAFRKSDKTFEGAYFKNPGDITVNPKAFYETIGGDDVVSVDLFQAGNSSAVIETTNKLNRYKNKRFVDSKMLTFDNVYKPVRDKRKQVITYLTAAEASVGGLSKYIENYFPNVYSIGNCTTPFPDDASGAGGGLKGEYFKGKKFEEKLFERIDRTIYFNGKDEINTNLPAGAARLDNNFSVRWTGRVKAPGTGSYRFSTNSDDGIRVYLNDTLIIDRWNDHANRLDSAWVNLVGGELYNLKVEYYQAGGGVIMKMEWRPTEMASVPIPAENLYQMPTVDTFVVGNVLSREKRVNDFRKANHISEIDVLNDDGRRYVYGVPVYNLKQKDLTFSIAPKTGNRLEGLTKYESGVDNTLNNNKGNDNYFDSEEMPAYAQTFLLSGVVSPDYADLTGDGISDDDAGTAIRFNYTKTAGVKNPYRWRSPAVDSASYNEGLRTDIRDDKASYVYGEKELWYLHSIESKNMIATFKLSDREDQFAMNEDGVKQTGRIMKKLEEINLYTKADFKKYNTAARPIRTVHFEYSYELCPGANRAVNNSGKLTLKRIWFSYNGNDKGKRNPYIFTYSDHNPVYTLKSNDRWGNFKDMYQNPGSTQQSPIINSEYPYSVQDSAVAARNAAAWALTDITLPSGARIKVDYEADDYAYVQDKRATCMMKVVGLSLTTPNSLNDLHTSLYGPFDYRYVAVNVSQAVTSNKEVYDRYLKGNEKVYFKLAVQVPTDKYGAGIEYVPCYATLDNDYGFFNDGKTIWFKVKYIDAGGDINDPNSLFSPMAQTALQFLRLNLPSKAYPGSEVGGNIDLQDAITLLVSQADNLTNTFLTYSVAARVKGWMKDIDTNRTLVRLNAPYYRKYGGGHRVKRIRISDNWNKMTTMKESVYGTEYSYNMTDDAGTEVISSGVASYEPLIGGEENVWRQPIEYNKQASVLAPVEMGYTEAPLGESFFPAPSVGYRKVRVRSINNTGVRSATGFEETSFYTTYDFPVYTDMTLLADGKKRFKPLLANLLRINARHFVALSQGFKVELNDMNGKMKSHGIYAETDAAKPVTYTENIYKIDRSRERDGAVRLSNTVTTIAPDGTIDTEGIIGKDMELMLDMRHHKSVTNANNLNANTELFTFGFPPIFILPTLLGLAQREEVQFRSVAAAKVINRHGILDSVVVIDKGSTISTSNLAYDNETGEVILTRTQNVFGDPVYEFKWPAGWVYDGMSGAYKNINVVLSSLFITKGRITSGLGNATADAYFAGGDEILVASKVKTGGDDCSPKIATFPATSKLYAVDINAVNGGTPDIFLVDENGVPFTGNDVSLKVIRSGRKNMSADAGEVIMLNNPLVKVGNAYQLVIDQNSKVIKASATEYKQDWQVADKKKQKTVCAD